MRLTEYIKSRGLPVRAVSAQLKLSRAQIYSYNTGIQPHPRTVKKIADAMSELGADTTPIDLYQNVFTGE